MEFTSEENHVYFRVKPRKLPGKIQETSGFVRGNLRDSWRDIRDFLRALLAKSDGTPVKLERMSENFKGISGGSLKKF